MEGEEVISMKLQPQKVSGTKIWKVAVGKRTDEAGAQKALNQLEKIERLDRALRDVFM